ERTGEVDFETRFGIAEVVRTKPDLHVFAHQLPEHEFHRALEIGGGDAFVDVKTFDLLKGRVVRGVGVVAAIDAAGDDDADGRLLFLHHADLDGARVSAQKPFWVPGSGFRVA